MYRFATVENVEYADEFAEIIAVCDKRAGGMFEKWKK